MRAALGALDHNCNCDRSQVWIRLLAIFCDNLMLGHVLWQSEARRIEGRVASGLNIATPQLKAGSSC